MLTRVCAVFCSAAAACSALGQIQVKPAPPAPLNGLKYDAPFFPGAAHIDAVPTPDSVLGFRVGDRPATHAQIEAYVKALAASSKRVKLFEYATSHEGRKLYYLAIGSEPNIAKLDQIKAQAAKLGDPRSTTSQEADAIADSIPAIAWMAYVIHGDEMSGSDAALSLMHHLAAGTGEDVTSVLANVVVLVDPLMNPDGRDRCINGINQARTAQPAVDDQAVIHSEVWPSGRMNHYLFDMNRDWIFCSQPESRGRVIAAGAWNPHYFMESHEMGSQDTFLFMPPRQPINHNIPGTIHAWAEKFAADQGKALDRHGWRYYTGEWNEEWYPGYSGSWAALRGAIDNLYEQASIQTDAVRHLEGRLEPYREGVHKQLVSSWANLTTLAANRKAVVKDFLESRRRACGLANGAEPGAARLFVVTPPAGNAGRWLKFVDLMNLQGIELYSAGAEFKAAGRDWLGRDFADRAFPAGSVIIPARQPLGNLASALLELDPRMSPEFLTEERRELLRFGRSRLYDITAWNLAMLHGIEICEARCDLPQGAARANFDGLRAAPAETSPEALAYFFDGRDDRSLSVASRLMDRGVNVRATDKPTRLGSVDIPRGSIVVTIKDNEQTAPDWRTVVAEVSTQFGLSAQSVSSGMGPGDAPDLGGEHFVLLQNPRVALLSRDPFGPYTVGEVWHLLDHEMGLRISLIDTNQLGGIDLRRYNVLVVPDGPPRGWSEKIPEIRAWVEAGGTLIAIGDGAAPFAKEGGIGSVRLLPDVLAKLEEFRAAIVRDWLGKSVVVKPDEVWSNSPPAKLEYPWTLGEGDKAGEDELKRRDNWRSLFMPQGALVAARADDRHWLTSGGEEILPVIVGGGPVLVPKFGGHAPLLLGAIVDAPPAPEPKPAEAAPKSAEAPGAEAKAPKPGDGKGEKGKDEPPPPGWTLAPPGHELRLRMSGLLWPEAADRLAHTAYATQERVGNGQVIFFAGSPTFRAATIGPRRIFANAVVLGPGMGTSQAIRP